MAAAYKKVEWNNAEEEQNVTLVKVGPAAYPVPRAFGRYDVGEKIGQGGYGEIYVGTDRATGERVAIKVAPEMDASLRHEAAVYEALKKKPSASGFAKMHWYGAVQHHAVMVVDLLDQNLGSFFSKKGKTLAPAAVLSIGRKVVSLLATLHQANYIHRDVKPENIMVRAAKTADGSPSLDFFLIDFGLSKLFIDPDTRRHVSEADEDEGFSGSPEYASLSALHGAGQSRRDDLEALGYTLLYFCLGRLPWQDVGGGSHEERLDVVTRIKQATDLPALCSATRTPAAIRDLIGYAQSLSFESTPDYGMIDSWFAKALGTQPAAPARL
ncbi:Casein kinase I [Diplonema papillatum]|nr:Casein kinase I [Diplonema papillatum]